MEVMLYTGLEPTSIEAAWTTVDAFHAQLTDNRWTPFSDAELDDLLAGIANPAPVLRILIAPTSNWESAPRSSGGVKDDLRADSVGRRTLPPRPADELGQGRALVGCGSAHRRSIRCRSRPARNGTRSAARPRARWMGNPRHQVVSPGRGCAVAEERSVFLRRGADVPVEGRSNGRRGAESS